MERQRHAGALGDVLQIGVSCKQGDPGKLLVCSGIRCRASRASRAGAVQRAGKPCMSHLSADRTTERKSSSSSVEAEPAHMRS